MVERLVKEIACDNRSGASEMLYRAAELFRLLQEEARAGDLEGARLIILDACAALARAQPHMAPLANLASRVASSCGGAQSAEEAFNRAARAARSFSEQAARAVHQAVAHAAALMEDGAVVLTHSRSSSVLTSLIEAHRSGRRFEVVATESRPLLEGRTLGESLAREGIKVTLIADAAAALVMGGVDFVIVGADRVTPESLVNKIGTRMITLAAREGGKPVYSLCDTSKFIAAALANDEQKSSDELWPDAPVGVKVLNRYFETTPLAHFAAIVTEDGPLAPSEASRRALAQPIHCELLDRLGLS
jgi:translation initiation factor 2B subunit (eIF-2B alpha/beta/delta family)